MVNSQGFYHHQKLCFVTYTYGIYISLYVSNIKYCILSGQGLERKDWRVKLPSEGKVPTFCLMEKTFYLTFLAIFFISVLTFCNCPCGLNNMKYFQINH